MIVNLKGNYHTSLIEMIKWLEKHVGPVEINRFPTIVGEGWIIKFGKVDQYEILFEDQTMEVAFSLGCLYA